MISFSNAPKVLHWATTESSLSWKRQKKKKEEKKEKKE
jgi:hypothetical protein